VATLSVEAQTFVELLQNSIGKGSKTKPDAQVKSLQSTVRAIDDGVWGKNTRKAAARELLRLVGTPSAAPAAATAAPANAAATAPTASAKASGESYTPISEAPAVEMPDVTIKGDKLSFEDLDNASFAKFTEGKSLVDLKQVYASFYQGTFEQTCAYLEKNYGIKDAGLFITYRTQLRSFELALMTRIRELESGIPGYSVMLADLADFNDNKVASENDKTSRGTENLLFARLAKMTPAQVRAMLLSAGTSVEDYQRNAANAKNVFRSHYQTAGHAGVAGGAIETGRIPEFTREEAKLRSNIVQLYNANKPEIERIAAESANLREIISHLPKNISKESFMQGIFLEYAGAVFGGANGAMVKFDISRLGLYFNSLAAVATPTMFGVVAGKKFQNASGSIRGEYGLMNFIPFGSIQADIYKSDPRVRDFFSKEKLDGQVRVTPFAMANVFDVGVGVTAMWNEKNPEILAQTVRFEDVMKKIVGDLKANKAPDLSVLSAQDQQEFTILVDVLKRLNAQMGGNAYDRLLPAVVMTYKTRLTEENVGYRLAGVNIGFGLGIGLVAGLVGGPIGTVAATLIGLANIERTKVGHITNKNGHTQEIEYNLTNAPRELRLFNRRSVVTADGSKLDAILLNKNEVTAVDTPDDPNIKIYKVRDGYVVTGAEKANLSIVNFDGNDGRAKVLTFDAPKSVYGTLGFQKHDPQDLPKGWKLEAVDGQSAARAEAEAEATERGIQSRLREVVDDASVQSVLDALEGFNTKADSFDLKLAKLFQAGVRGDRTSFDAAWKLFVSNVRTNAGGKWGMLQSSLAAIETAGTKGYEYKLVLLQEVFSRFMKTRSDADKIGVSDERYAEVVNGLKTSLGAEAVAKLDQHLASRPNTALDALPAGIPANKQADAKNYLRLMLPLSVYDTTLGTANKSDDRQTAFAERMAETGIPKNEAKRVQEAFNREHGNATHAGKTREFITDGFVLPVSSRLNPVFQGLTPMMGPVTLATVDGRIVDIPMQSSPAIRKAVVAMFPESVIAELAASLKTDEASLRRSMEAGDNPLLTFDVSYTKWGVCGNDGCRIRNVRIAGRSVNLSFSEGTVTVENIPETVGYLVGLGASINASGSVRTPKPDEKPTGSGTGSTKPNVGTDSGTHVNTPNTAF
jgi:hypothetical protein